MSLILTRITESGFTAKDSINRISQLTFQTNTTISFYVEAFKDKDQQIPFYREYRTCEIDPSSSVSILDQAYEYLLTLPEYDDASRSEL